MTKAAAASVDILHNVKDVFSSVYVRTVRCRLLSTYLRRSAQVSRERRSTDTNVLVFSTCQFGYSSANNCLAQSVLPRISPSTRYILASSENVYTVLYSHTALSTTTKETDEHNLTSVCMNCSKNNLLPMGLESFS
jgi:hypothetical protein